MNNFNIPDDKLSALLDAAGKKLGRDPQQLRSELQNGKLDNVLGNLDPKTAAQVSGLLNDRKALDALINNPALGNMLNGILGGKK